MNRAAQALARLQQQAAVWVTVDSTQGSVPRDAGTWMAVFADGVVGTIGGGRVEFEAIAEARRRLAGMPASPLLRYPLGPGLGQCCGGDMHLRFEPMQGADVPLLRTRLARSGNCPAPSPGSTAATRYFPGNFPTMWSASIPIRCTRQWRRSRRAAMCWS